MKRQLQPPLPLFPRKRGYNKYLFTFLLTETLNRYIVTLYRNVTINSNVDTELKISEVKNENQDGFDLQVHF